MSNSVFALKNPLVLPSNNVIGAFIVFPVNKFAVSYKIQPNALTKTMDVSIFISDRDGNRQWDLINYAITDDGFDTGIMSNQSAIDGWTANYTNLQNTLAVQTMQMAALSIDPITNADAISALQNELNVTNTGLSNLGSKPIPNKLIVNKYSDVIKYFNNDGTITSDGIIWAKSLPFPGTKLTMGDLLQL